MTQAQSRIYLPGWEGLPEGQQTVCDALENGHCVEWEVHRHNLREVVGFKDGTAYLFLTSREPGMVHYPKICNTAIYDTINETLGPQTIHPRGWKLCNPDSAIDPKYPTTTVWELDYSREKPSIK